MAASSNIKKVSIQLVGKSGKMGRRIAALAEADPDVEISEEGDVVIDFSAPEGTKKAIALGKPLVCGTTGLGEEIFAQMEKLSQKVPVLYSPNFSLGMALLFEMLEQCSDQLQGMGRVEIEEIHQKGKKDCPSGTALKLAKVVGTEKISSKRSEDLRLFHQVKIFLDHEELSFSHEAFSRDVYARGAIHAAKWLLGRPAKFYTLKEIFT